VEPNVCEVVKADIETESNWSGMNDEQIIERVLAGDTEAYRLLVERHERSVFGFVHGMVSNLSDVEDLAQEAFIAAFKNLSSFDARRAKFSTWLLTIAHNRCCNHLKRRSPKPSDMNDVMCGVASPETAATNRETLDRLDEALSNMTIEQRTAFVLAEIQQIPLAEIAAIEGIPVGTVKSRISRAKERLRRELKDLQSVEQDQTENQQPEKQW
jgi:RNA polymerase sigma-70 factor, ECF subfamily